MDIKYEIKFLDYWHLSSGLSAGSKLDSTVVKEDKGLPYIPGKTIKGLVREMASLLGDRVFVDTCFGTISEKRAEQKAGECYFSDVKLPGDLTKQIIDNDLQERLYDEIASTMIAQNGIAEDKSLREIEVVVPLTLKGEIENIPSEYEEKMKQSLKMIKRMGLNRNRGLGRCKVCIAEGDKSCES